jgi:hypothetical protein
LRITSAAGREVRDGSFASVRLGGHYGSFTPRAEVVACHPDDAKGQKEK